MPSRAEKIIGVIGVIGCEGSVAEGMTKRVRDTRA